MATTQKSICYHEPTARLRSFDELKALWSDDRFEYVGVSDSALVLQLGRILEEIRPRTIIISRPPEDVVRSFDLYMSGTGLRIAGQRHCEMAWPVLESYRSHPLVGWLDFDDAGDPQSVWEALHWLMPNAEFPKLLELMHMNVQVDRDWVLEEARKPHTNWHLDTSWRDARA